MQAYVAACKLTDMHIGGLALFSRIVRVTGGNRPCILTDDFDHGHGRDVHDDKCAREVRQ